MKKIIALVLVLVMLLATGCGAKDTKFERGTVSDTAYTSKFADITFTLPEGWVFSSDAELNALMDQTGEVLGQDVSKIADLTTVYDCMASREDATANIIIMYENTAITGNADISEKDYAKIVADGLVASGSSTGLNYQVGDFANKDIAGKTYYCGTATVDLGGGISMEQCYLMRKIGKYMLSICITTIPEYTESADDIIAKIS